MSDPRRFRDDAAAPRTELFRPAAGVYADIGMLQKVPAAEKNKVPPRYGIFSTFTVDALPG
jgi:hypothetical protein